MTGQRIPAAATVPLDKRSFFTLSRLEKVLGYSREELRFFASNAGSFYKPFIKKSKSRPFQKKVRSPKPRRIDNPTGKLKALQRSIHRKLLRPLVLPNYLCGGVKGKTIVDNIRVHLGSKVLVTVDIKSFFPSITNFHVYRIWKDVLNFAPRVARLLTKVTTFERRLPQGAPTSTILANPVLYSVDGPIREECERHEVKYSSWVDDLAFSGKDSRIVINTVIETLAKSGFAVSHRKLKVMGVKKRKLLNGILLGKEASITPERLSQLRSAIHKLRTNQVSESELESYLLSLAGSIQQISTISPRKAARFRSDLVSSLSPRWANWSPSVES